MADLEDDPAPMASMIDMGGPQTSGPQNISSEEEEEQGDNGQSANATTKGTAAGGSKGKSKKEKDVLPEALVRKKRA